MSPTSQVSFSLFPFLFVFHSGLSQKATSGRGEREGSIKEQKLKDDIRGLREQLTGLVRGEGGGLGMADTREGLGLSAVSHGDW